MIGVSIEKKVSWRGGDEVFSNVYHYTTAGTLTAAAAQTVVDYVKAAEVPVHASTVTFTTGRVWSAGGTPAENETILIATLTGTGSAAADPEMDREATYLVEFPTSRPSATGRPVTLKKFIHSCSTFGSTTVGVKAGTAQLPTAITNMLSTYANSVVSMNTSSTSGTLCAPSSTGRTAFGTKFIFPWIEHHEFT